MAMVKKYKAEVDSISNIIDGVITLCFKSKGRSFKYFPGQFIHLALDEFDPSEGWPESRCFSIQSTSSDPFLKLTYAIKGKFTTRMFNEIKVGDIYDLKLPYGDLFTQEHSKINTVFIAGGTGITPFLSLFMDKSFSDYKNPSIYLGFKTKLHNTYQNDLGHILNFNSPTITTYYEDEVGIIDIENILNVSDRKTSFFISGPPIMIKSFKEFLIHNGIDKHQIKTDDWE